MENNQNFGVITTRFACPAVKPRATGDSILTQVIDFQTGKIRNQISCIRANSKEHVLAKLERELERNTNVGANDNAKEIREIIARITASSQDAYCVFDMFGFYPQTFNPTECHHGDSLAFPKSPIS